MKITYTLSKYLARAYFKWFVITASVSACIFALFEMLELFRRTADKPEVGFKLVLKLFAFRFPSYFQEIIPFIALFAAIITFWRLNRSQELLIIKAAGVSIWEMLTPVAATALLIGIFDLLILNSFSATLLSKFQHLEERVIYKKQTPFSLSKNGFWLRDIYEDKSIIINAKNFDIEQGTLYNFTAYIFNNEEQFQERIDAKIGVIAQGSLQLQHGWKVEKDGFPQQFSSYKMPSNLSVKNIQESFSDPKTLTVYNLRSYAKLMEDSGLSANQYFMQWHALIVRCLWLVVMVIIAATFTLRPMRSGGTVKIFVSGIAITFVLYFLRDVTYALGYAGTLPPILAAWAPTLILALGSVSNLLIKEDG